MPTFEDDHFFLLDLATILEPQSSYSLDYTFGSINEEISFLNNDKWDEYANGGPEPIETIDATPYNWYTQYWHQCAAIGQCADFDGFDLRALCDYVFNYDESIHTNDDFDKY